MKMKRVDQRYKQGKSASELMSPGVDASGKPSMDTTCMKFCPILGTTPPQNS